MSNFLLSFASAESLSKVGYLMTDSRYPRAASGAF
jgi:hypothetical protein